MSDLNLHTEKIKSGESWLEKIKRYIPGYDGYVNRDNAREIDNLLRTNLAGKLEENKTLIKNTVLKLSQEGKLFETAGIEKLDKKNETAIAKFRSAARGYSGAFDISKTKEEKLNMLYDFDLSLLSAVESLKNDFALLESKANEGIKEQSDIVSVNLDNLLKKFDEREELLRKL
jgi:hypothetical protein